MKPKMTITDAAQSLGYSQSKAYSRLLDLDLSTISDCNQLYFEHKVATRFFQLSFSPKIVVFQILKGGTGKTSLAFEFAVRASLYGAEVLCIDLDSQGNLTQAFNQNAEEVPVMVDHLVEGFPIFDSLVRVMDGIDILPSRIENAMLDEIIRDKHLSLDKVYRDPFTSLKSFYDLIVVDCPPSLGQSVAAAALASDTIIMPVTPEKFALNGLETTINTMRELEETYQIKIDDRTVLNKFEVNNERSEDALRFLVEHRRYHSKLLAQKVRLSSEFPKASAQSISIFDKVELSDAKEDVDALTRELLGIQNLSLVTENLELENDKNNKNEKRDKLTEINLPTEEGSTATAFSQSLVF